MPAKNYRSLVYFLLFLFSVFPVAAQIPSHRAHNFDVQNYIIRTSFDRANNTVFGDTIVQLKPLADDFKIVELDAAEMNFESVRLESENKDLQFKVLGQKVYITLDKTYSPADLVSIRFKYSIVQPRKGVYFIDAVKDGKKTIRDAQIWTQGEAVEAHYWFPSCDSPEDKATTEQFITVEKDETAIANGEPMETINNSDGTKTFHFKMPLPHSTYLTSFVVGTYAKISDSYKNIPLGYYVYPNKTDIVQKTYGKTKDIMRVFEELTGVAFPYNKYDQTIVAKFNFGGMENITATTMSDNEIFETPRNEVEDLVSHELAHSWFGNLVTCRNWSELWLNEGFADYMEAAYREKMYGRADYLRKIGEDAKMFFVDEAVNQERHALFNRTARPENDSIFDTTTYQKGGAILHTLRETVGTENFWKAVNIYLNRHKFQTVETAELQRVMEEVSGKDLKWFFAQWVYAAGYPKLNVKPVYNPATKNLHLTVTQTQELDKITPGAFILPMEVEIKTKKGTKTEWIEIKNRTENFILKVDDKPTEIIFDKGEKIPLKSINIESLKKSSEENQS